MLREFESNILKNELFNKKHPLLLAISGGIDSVVLAHLLKESGFQFSLVHCNFKLRDKDSDADESFCRHLAKELNVEIFTKVFNTKAYSKEHKLNIQLAARKLRYDWFRELIETGQFSYVLTAHHANDVMETLFINLLRGTGIKGLKGIPVKNDAIIRPLLYFTREQIEAYAKKKHLFFRLDKSNLEDKYERNFIRLNIIPLLKKINPSLEETFIRNTANFRQEAEIVNNYLEERCAGLVTQTPGMLFISKKKLKKEPQVQTVLHHLLNGYGFNDTQQRNILDVITTNALPGKQFLSPTHQLIVDRNDLVVKPRIHDEFRAIRISSLTELKQKDLFLVSEIKKFTVPEKDELIVQKNRLIFPLELRTKKTGDKFKPFGMKGFKLLSDFFKDEKLNAFQKESCKVLQNGNGEIIWIAGYRSDERYRVKPGDKDLIKLKFVG